MAHDESKMKQEAANAAAPMEQMSGDELEGINGGFSLANAAEVGAGVGAVAMGVFAAPAVAAAGVAALGDAAVAGTLFGGAAAAGAAVGTAVDGAVHGVEDVADDIKKLL